jgi:hypothetical protein
MKGFFTSAAALAIALASPAAAATQIVNGSRQLTGATGVIVNGTSYDVEFVDGTCAALFGGCDSVSDFTFQSQTDASAAAYSLVHQVFLNTTAGQFDSVPSLILGCGDTFTGSCGAVIPYGLSDAAPFAEEAYNCREDLFFCADNVKFNNNLALTNDLTIYPDLVWARFTPSAAAVPEPSTWAMMLLGFGAIGFAARWRRALAASSLSSAGGEA